MKMKYIPPVLLILISWVILLPFLCYAAQLRELSNQLFDALILPVCVAFPIILIANVYCACFRAYLFGAFPWRKAEFYKRRRCGYNACRLCPK